ncbi:MAG: type II secretion system F family protein [Fimbriimonadaceae bacterium]
MPTYEYVARDQSGKQAKGRLTADGESQLREVLREQGLYLTSWQQRGGGVLSAEPTPGSTASKRLKLQDMVVFSRQFATLVRAGLPIIECLSIAGAQSEAYKLASALDKVREDVLGGATLAAAMRKHPKVFSPLYCSLVEAGEASGTLDTTLDFAATELDREAELREKVKSAFTYPTLVIVTAVGLIWFMLVFVVPTFSAVYKQFNAELPFMTRLLIFASEIVTQRFVWVAAFILAAIFLFRRWYATENGRLTVDRMKLRMPLFGQLNRKIAIARFTQTWSSATRSGLPVMRSIEVSATTSGNKVIEKSVIEASKDVQDGAALATVLNATGHFPPLVTRMVSAGERSGNLEEMLEEVAKFYHRDVDYTVERLTRLMEAVMTIIIGGIVLVVLLALYMPIFSLSKVIR